MKRLLFENDQNTIRAEYIVEGTPTRLELPIYRKELGPPSRRVTFSFIPRCVGPDGDRYGLRYGYEPARGAVVVENSGTQSHQMLADGDRIILHGRLIVI